MLLRYNDNICSFLFLTVVILFALETILKLILGLNCIIKRGWCRKKNQRRIVEINRKTLPLYNAYKKHLFGIYSDKWNAPMHNIDDADVCLFFTKRDKLFSRWIYLHTRMYSFTNEWSQLENATYVWNSVLLIIVNSRFIWYKIKRKKDNSICSSK